MKAKPSPLKLPFGLLPKVKPLPTERVLSHLCELQDLQATHRLTPRPVQSPIFKLENPQNYPIPPNNLKSSYTEAVSVQEVYLIVWESIAISLQFPNSWDQRSQTLGKGLSINILDFAGHRCLHFNQSTMPQCKSDDRWYGNKWAWLCSNKTYGHWNVNSI